MAERAARAAGTSLLLPPPLRAGFTDPPTRSGPLNVGPGVSPGACPRSAPAPGALMPVALRPVPTASVACGDGRPASPWAPRQQLQLREPLRFPWNPRLSGTSLMSVSDDFGLSGRGTWGCAAPNPLTPSRAAASPDQGPALPGGDQPVARGPRP